MSLDLKDAFINKLEEEDLEYGTLGNFVSLTIKRSMGIDVVLNIGIAFYETKIKVSLIDLAVAKKRGEALALINNLNRDTAWGKFYMRDNGKINFESYKWYTEDEYDEDMVFWLINKCIADVEDAYEQIIYSKCC